jgi:general nucleoside transport system permease protein
MSYAVAAPVAAFGVAAVVTALALLAGGHNPFVAFGKMGHYAASVDSVVVVINKSLPLFVSGLAVAIGFKTNLFNIGVEGQYRLAAIIAAAVGVGMPGPGWLRIIVTMLTAIVVGALWAGIAGVLKAYRNVNEVIATIMLNGVFASLLGILLKWSAIASVKGAIRQTREFPESAWFPSLTIKGSTLYMWVFVAILLGVGYHFLVNRSRFGYDLRASGMNPGAALASGVSPKRMIITTMLISGGLAGMVGMPILLQDTHKFTQDFPSGYGFGGIAVALVGRQKAGGIAVAAVLFALIARMSQVLPDPPLQAPKEIGTIMQGTMMLSAVIAYEVVRRRSEAAAIRDAAIRTAAVAS